jgi:5-hydroxyisourate hydrolase
VSISTHVLDATNGSPARGMRLALLRREGELYTQIADGVTDEDGRCPDLAASVRTAPGVYRMRFETGEWFAARGTPTFYPVVELTFEVVDAAAHHHVPLLMSPFAFSTYRGS